MTIGISDVWEVAARVISVQIAAFAWRVSREVGESDVGDITWLPPADILNLAAMVVAFLGVFLFPILGIGPPRLPELALGLSIVLFVGYPFALAGHYELYTRGPRTYGPAPRQERIAIVVTVLLAAAYLAVVITRQPW
jgi:hypothetical protein